MQKNISPDWVENIILAKNILIRGRETYEQINILGDDGVPIDYHVIFWKSEVVDFVILQQDAFDKVDASTPIKRQRYMMDKVLEVYHTDFEFESFEEVNPYFKKIINVFKQMNYSEFDSENFRKYESELKTILQERKKEKAEIV
jgi:V/A-type H+-transporting ATPase subunit A